MIRQCLAKNGLWVAPWTDLRNFGLFMLVIDLCKSFHSKLMKRKQFVADFLCKKVENNTFGDAPFIMEYRHSFKILGVTIQIMSERSCW